MSKGAFHLSRSLPPACAGHRVSPKINKGAPSRSSIQLNPITFFAAARPSSSSSSRPARIRTAGRACGAREHWWRPLSIRNDFRGWFYPPTFLISATRPPRYRDSGATLRRFELRGEPREYGLTPGSFRRETERWARVERRKGGKGEKTRSEGTNRQEGTRNRASLFSLFIFYFSKEPYARRMRTPRSPDPPKFNKYGPVE